MRSNSIWLVAVVLCVVPLVAAADDYRFVHSPGFNCKLYAPQQQDTFLDPYGFSVADLKNTSTTTKYVGCPVQRMELPNYSNSEVNVAGAILSVSSGNVQMYLRSADGSSFSSYSPTTIGAYGSMWAYVISAQPVLTGKSISYYVTLPAGSRIGSYTLNTRFY